MSITPTLLNYRQRWKLARKAERKMYKASKKRREKELARINRHTRLEKKNMTNKQKKVVEEIKQIVDKGTELVHPFLMVFNKLKITHKFEPFSGMCDRNKHWTNSHCFRLSDFYSVKPEIPPKGNPKKEKSLRSGGRPRGNR